jgi:hypothetical protein
MTSTPKKPPALRPAKATVAPQAKSVQSGIGHSSAPIAAPTPNVWSKDALLSKAQRYAEEMNRYDRDDWRFGLWASLTLEVLGRAALANVSPVLLAEASKDSWDNLYYALGRVPNTSKFIPRSIDVSGVFARLREILPTFENRLAGLAATLLARRNEDLHSGGTPFDEVSPGSWLPLFYEACDVLMNSIGLKLNDLIGVSDAKTAAAMISAAKDESAKAVGKSISAHKTVWDAKAEAERKKLAQQSTVWATKQVGHRVKCPACASDALVHGAPVAPPTQSLEDDLIIERQQMLPSRFECVACGLKVSGLPQLHACGLGDPYTFTSSYDAADYYLEMAAEHYEPDNND